jgi:hypothetical protein
MENEETRRNNDMYSFMNVYMDTFMNTAAYANTIIRPNYNTAPIVTISPDDLKRAIDNHSHNTVSLLFDMGADPHWTYEWLAPDGTNQWGSALHYAVSIATKPYTQEEVCNHSDIVMRILDTGIDSDGDGGHNSNETPLKLAIKCGNVEAVDMLLNRGADPNYWMADLDEDSPIVCSIKRGDARITDLLIDAGADVNSDDFTKSPLYVAISLNDVISINALINAGANREGRMGLDGYEFTWQVTKVTVQM